MLVSLCVGATVSRGLRLNSGASERGGKNAHEGMSPAHHRVTRGIPDPRDEYYIQLAGRGLESIFGLKAGQSLLSPQRRSKASRRNRFIPPKATSSYVPKSPGVIPAAPNTSLEVTTSSPTNKLGNAEWQEKYLNLTRDRLLEISRNFSAENDRQEGVLGKAL